MQGPTSAKANRARFPLSLRGAVGVGAVVVAGLACSCLARPQMCSGAGAAGACTKSEGECVAGRCLPPNGGGLDGGGPEIRSASPAVRRIVATPVEMALVGPGDGQLAGALPALLTLGRVSDGGARLLLRFAVPLTTRSKIVEAYVLLEQADVVDADPAPVTLHVARVVDGWDARSLSWGRLPHVESGRTPETVVVPAARGLVRIAATELVSAWRTHDPRDQGLAVVASTRSVTGISFASGGSTTTSPAVLTPLSAPFDAVESTRGGGPRLEVYVK